MTTYTIEVMNGFMTETPEGFRRPQPKVIFNFNKFSEALDFYKNQKSKKSDAVIFVNRDGSIRHFKTI